MRESSKQLSLHLCAICTSAYFFALKILAVTNELDAFFDLKSNLTPRELMKDDILQPLKQKIGLLKKITLISCAQLGKRLIS